MLFAIRWWQSVAVVVASLAFSTKISRNEKRKTQTATASTTTTHENKIEKEHWRFIKKQEIENQEYFILQNTYERIRKMKPLVLLCCWRYVYRTIWFNVLLFLAFFPVWLVLFCSVFFSPLGCRLGLFLHLSLIRTDFVYGNIVASIQQQ